MTVQPEPVTWQGTTRHNAVQPVTAHDGLHSATSSANATCDGLPGCRKPVTPVTISAEQAPFGCRFSCDGSGHETIARPLAARIGSSRRWVACRCLDHSARPAGRPIRFPSLPAAGHPDAIGVLTEALNRIDSVLRVRADTALRVALAPLAANGDRDEAPTHVDHAAQFDIQVGSACQRRRITTFRPQLASPQWTGHTPAVGAAVGRR
jgi:hypothetical protein